MSYLDYLKEQRKTVINFESLVKQVPQSIKFGNVAVFKPELKVNEVNDSNPKIVYVWEFKDLKDRGVTISGKESFEVSIGNDLHVEVQNSGANISENGFAKNIKDLPGKINELVSAAIKRRLGEREK